MRTLLLIFVSFSSCFAIAAPMPDEFIGIWTTTTSEFRGDLLWKGSAIYLDSDGVGAWTGGDGANVLGVRIVVTSYDPATHILAFQMTEHGKVVGTGSLIYDPTAHILISSPDNKKFELRKAGQLAMDVRKSLGLERKQVQ